MLATTRAYGYLRVSSVGQAADDRDGLARQKAAVAEYCKKHDIKIARWFTDVVSGTKDLEDRPGLFNLMRALHANGVRTVIIEKLDRLARDLRIQESILADLKRKDFAIISCAEPDLLSDDPTRTILRQMMGAFSQYERAMIVAKLKGARQRARAAKPGYREGRKVFGHLGGEPETIKRILKLRKDGLAYDTIAERLNADSKYPARKGKWHPTSVARVVQRHGP